MTNKLKKIKKYGKKYNGGFTLIETLIAVFVLMLAISGPLTLAEKGLHVTVVAKDQDAAFYLAQDAIEYVRWVRDTNKLRGNSWLAGLDNTSNGHTTTQSTTDCTGANGCTVDSLRDIVNSCSGACAALLYDTNYNNYTYSSGTGVNTSIFTRTVKITPNVSGNAGEATVAVTVSWYDQGSLQRIITVREEMFDWQ